MIQVPVALDPARRVNPGIEVIEVSATTGAGMDDWLEWIARGAAGARGERQETVESLGS